jgi:hypothetical protein
MGFEQNWGNIIQSKLFHVARPELERKFEIVLFTENARIELKSSAKKS